MIKKDDNREDLAHIRDSLEPFKDYHVPGGIPEFRWVDFPQLGYLDIKQTRPEEVTREEFDQLVERVKKLEGHTEIHKESFNDFN